MTSPVEILDPVAFVKDLTAQVDRIKATLSAKFLPANGAAPAPAATPVVDPVKAAVPAASGSSELIYEKTYVVNEEDETKMVKRVKKGAERIANSQRDTKAGFFLEASVSVVKFPEDGKCKIVLRVRCMDTEEAQELLTVLVDEEENDKPSEFSPAFDMTSRIMTCQPSSLQAFSKARKGDVAPAVKFAPEPAAPAKPAQDTLGPLGANPKKLAPKRGAKARRKSFSAESITPTANFQMVVHEKDDVAKKLILEACQKNALFKHVDDDNLVKLVGAFKKKDVPKGEDLIKQGDAGNHFYVVESGEFLIFVEGVKGPGLEGSVMHPKRGSSFGELALMHDAPRAATVRAYTDAVVWELDRVTCNTTIVNASHARRKLYNEFCTKIPLFRESLSDAEIQRISDVLNSSTFQDGEYILTQGDTGDSFYIIEEGEVVCLKSKEVDGETQTREVLRLHTGQYFGELALLNNDPRAASVVACGSVKVGYLDRDAFVRLLGPCQEVLRRNTGEYKSFEEGQSSTR